MQDMCSCCQCDGEDSPSPAELPASETGGHMCQEGKEKQTDRAEDDGAATSQVVVRGSLRR